MASGYKTGKPIFGMRAYCPSVWACMAGLGLSFLPLASAFAAEGDKGASEVVFISQLMVLIFVGRMLGEFMQRIGQPAVTGQLIAGILLGPTVFGLLLPDMQHWLFPAQKEQKAMLDAISQVGILMLLLLTGMETDLRLVRRAGLAAASVSLAGIIVPFICGFALGEMLPDAMLPRPELRIITSLFLGTALSIASIKIVAMVVREMNYMRRNLGQLIVSSAIIDDSIGWIIIAIIFSLAEHGSVDLPSVARGVLGTFIFLALSFTVGRRIVFFVIRWTNDNFVSDVPVISAILLIMGGMALITHSIGVHTVLGAFVAGILIGESPILTRHIEEQLRGLITALFAPVFFGAAGIGTDLTILKDPKLLLLTIGLILIASIGKFGGAFLGGKIGGLTQKESFALALGMNARGSTEVIIATIGLSLGALSKDLFSMIVAMAVVTTMAMPPSLRWALNRLPLHKDEEERLKREAFAERGFVTNLERLLLAVDDTANGKFAARLGGVLAGSLGMPTTILRLDPPVAEKEDNADNEKTAAESKENSGKDKKQAAKATEKQAAKTQDKISSKDEKTEKKEKTESDVTEAAVKATAEKTKPLDGRENDLKSPPVDIRSSQGASAKEAVAKEAEKGYDLLMVGFDKTTSAPGIFDRKVSQAAGGFEGPVAIVRAAGKHLKRPLQSRMDILVPVTGTGVSRRGAEMALALAHATNARITALYVSNSPPQHKSKRRFQRALATQLAEGAILKDVAEMADRFDVTMKTAARVNTAPEEAILREAQRGGYDLIVMGVNRRPGKNLFFGRIAAEILEQENISVLFVASEVYAQERRPTEREEVAT